MMEPTDKDYQHATINLLEIQIEQLQAQNANCETLKRRLAEADHLISGILAFHKYWLGANLSFDAAHSLEHWTINAQAFLAHQPGEYVAVRREDLKILLSDPGYMPGPIEAEAYDNLKSALEVKETKWKRYNI